MLQHFFAYQVEAMRRAAKQISRNEGIPYSEAQNRIAREKGYRNWSLLQKNGLQDPNVRPQFFFRRTDEEVASSMRFVPDPGPYARQTRSQVAQACVTDLCRRQERVRLRNRLSGGCPKSAQVSGLHRCSHLLGNALLAPLCHPSSR